MMDGTMPGMMLAMGLIWLPVVVVLILSAAGLVKYLLFWTQGRPTVSKFAIVAAGKRAVSALARVSKYNVYERLKRNADPIEHVMHDKRCGDTGAHRNNPATCIY
jgi:hypothetical protein